MSDRIIREPECGNKSGLSRSTRWRLEKRGLFPKRREISPNARGWLLSEIEAWLTNRPEKMGPAPTEALKKRAATSHADRRDSGDATSPEAA